MHQDLLGSREFFKISFSQNNSELLYNVASHGEKEGKLYDWLSKRFINKQYLREKQFDMHFEVLEISNIIKPSDVSIIVRQGKSEKYIPLYKHIDKIRYLHQSYYLNIAKEEEFQVDIDSDVFQVKILVEPGMGDWWINILGEFVELKDNSLVSTL